MTRPLRLLAPLVVLGVLAAGCAGSGDADRGAGSGATPAPPSAGAEDRAEAAADACAAGSDDEGEASQPAWRKNMVLTASSPSISFSRRLMSSAMNCKD